MREGQGIEDGWLVGAQIKDQKGLMKDRVRQNCEYFVRFRLKKGDKESIG